MAGVKDIRPFSHILEGGLSELIGVDQQVSQDQYSDSVEFDLLGASEDQRSGEILAVSLYATEDDSGAIITEDGTLLFLDADPSISAGAASLGAAVWLTVIGSVTVAAADWVEDASGGLFHAAVAIPFHALSTLYAVYLHRGATQWNSAAGDDEQLELNFWYRRDR